MRSIAIAAPLATALLAGGCALHQHPAAPGTRGAIQGPGYSSETVRYRCESGTEIEVAYLEFGHGDSFAALHHQGRTALLKSRPSASGVRYIALDEQHSLRWNTKGEEGFLSFLAADHTAQERVLLANCKSLQSLSAGKAAS
ncbi:MAG: lysozyme inhibitor [Hydrogenophaga sp.]|uniref:MliC family protein n=1 Tax=Hydrogenophaga sp. TaxID=1904254 RepID=UPI0016A89EA3|nr:MliC family protein [Hydrogenophaga sp.]NIM41571.1 lysozyme inhibitor [Hydrogenophaga sp.]NIN26879.1 lysozyme inhibitor [Hydrogenophaga sp.]NIN31580.1 lysozyme inhibitor [Hydrogenophaga sp.]NIN55813.1 lysozyme inhibitor [Hydrogenophaga sp.]NIO51981.1 lysozyme inhibitor [Hydrogenophaga sp.]